MPSPLLTETNEATVTFISRTGNRGSSSEEQVSQISNSLTFLFEMGVRKRECLWPFTLEFPDTGSGWGSVAALVEGRTVHSADYPDLGPTHVRCHCFIHAPEKHTVKVSI